MLESRSIDISIGCLVTSNIGAAIFVQQYIVRLHGQSQGMAEGWGWGTSEINNDKMSLCLKIAQRSLQRHTGQRDTHLNVPVYELGMHCNQTISYIAYDAESLEEFQWFTVSVPIAMDKAIQRASWRMPQ